MVNHPMKPGTYTVTSGYGPRWGTFHAGVDFAAPVGTPIYAPADGVIVEGKERARGSVSGYGSWIWLDCQDSVGKDFIFGHVHHPGILVKKGQKVKAGEQIGVVGNEGLSTGPHLHFEVWGSPGGTSGEHEDPQVYLEEHQEGESSMAAHVLDYSASQIPADKIRQSGAIGAVRYISPPREPWMKGKPATAEEMADFKKHALDVAFVWQFGGADAPDSMRGREGGLRDATAAELRLKEIGAEGFPVFFAVDFDISLGQWNNTAVEYFRACCEVLGKDRVGIYGHSRVCDWAREDGVIGAAGAGKFLMWQTRSWSNGVVHPMAVLHQNVHNVPGPNGVQIDKSEVLGKFWGQHPPRPDQAADKADTDPVATVEPPALKPMQPLTEQFRCDADLLTWRDNGISRSKRRAVCLHTDESSYDYAARRLRDTAWTADQLAEYNRRRDVPGGSYHMGIDREGRTVRQNDDVYGTWSVGSKGNDEMFHICLTGSAFQTREQWLKYPKQLDKAAMVIAHYCRRYGISTDRLTLSGLRAGKTGIVGHWDCSKFYGGSDHWDPGGYDGSTGVPKTAGGFPWDYVVRKVKEYAASPEKKVVEDIKKETSAVALELDTVVETYVAGSDFRDKLGNFILHADENSFLAMKNTELILKSLERLDGRLAAVEKRLEGLGG